VQGAKALSSFTQCKSGAVLVSKRHSAENGVCFSVPVQQQVLGHMKGHGRTAFLCRFENKTVSKMVNMRYHVIMEIYLRYASEMVMHWDTKAIGGFHESM